MNNTNLIGRVTADVQVKKTPSGHSFAPFCVAVKRRTEKEATDFIQCIAWNSLADMLGRYVKKGHKVGVSGHIQTRTYKDRDNKTIYVTEVVVEAFDFLENKPQEANRATQSDYSTADEAPMALDGMDAELPF